MSSDPPAPASPTAMPIVGIGTTIENENALRSFFGALPPAPNMAFAVVPASVPDASRTHSLSGVLRDCTDLAVQPLSEGTRPAPGTVSVCPPGRQVRLHDGQFHLKDAGSAHASPGAVDTLFQSLVAERGTRAIGVLLGNTLPDGLLGLRSFKEHGALVLAEMPEARGPDTPFYLEDELVDTYDRADQLAADLPRYWACAADSEDAPEQNEDLLTTIFAHLYAETDHDFSKYERSTVWRRIQRRMAVHHLSSPDAYLNHIQRDPAEVQALFRELLISVTSFFRTSEAFQALEEQVIPRLFAGKDRSDCVRVWSAGCATGEEAYSLAMLLDEHAASLPRAPEIQIFATDPSPQAIRRARDGRYARSVVAELSEARRARHLRQVGENYRIKKALRDRVLFAQHDLLTDPPFSKIDLVACRNVLIYLQRSVHSRVLRLLHYGLRPGGILFLGEAESAHDESDLFGPMNAHPALYRRNDTQRAGASVPAASLSRSPSQPPAQSAPPASADLRAAHQEALFDKVPSLLVDSRGDIVHLNEPATQHLSYQDGPPAHNILQATPSVLHAPLQQALHRVFQDRQPTGPTVVTPPEDTGAASFLLRVRPLRVAGQAPLLAQVMLDRLASRPAGAPAPDGEAPSAGGASSAHEWKRMNEDTQTTHDLQASNEKLRLLNEELQSKNEEIETSRTELRALNTQLEATNHELQEKVSELKQSNSDLRNLMQATDMATLFLDRELHIEWFTPQVREIFPLQEADTGRPISDLSKRLHYDRLVEDAETVLDRCAPIEREVECQEEEWFLVRLRPYRTLDDDVEGVVITFVDITDRKQAELEVRRDRNFIESLLNTVGALIVVLDADDRIVRFNQKCESVTGYSAAEVKGESIFDRLIPPEEADEVRAVFSSLRDGATPSPYEHHWCTRDQERRLIRWSNTALADEDGSVEYIIKTGVDVSERRQLERELTAISDRERQRIGQDLHDILASHLSGTAMMTQGVAQRVAEGKTVSADEIREISSLVQEASEQARTLSHSLMPLDIHGTDLMEGLENLARRQEEMTHVTCTVRGPDKAPALAPDVTAHLYRITSEAVTNALKHGDADHIRIRLEHGPDTLRLCVRDDGVGIPDDVPDDASLGLKMMRYRTNLIGGRIRIRAVDGADGGGTMVQCMLPLAKAAQSAMPHDHAET